MASIKEIMRHIPSKTEERDGDDMMSNPEYLRKSSALISEALQKGFDVMQLENGDIVTTGTKTIVTHYRWDLKARKMEKVSAREVAKGESPAKVSREVAESKPSGVKRGRKKAS